MFIKNDTKNKTRLVGKVGGHWVNVEKYTSRNLPDLVKTACALAVMVVGILIFLQF